MGKAEENKQTKKDSLLNTGFSLFTSKGFSNTSISDIAKNAGVAKGTFYLYFKDKYDLRNKLIASKANDLFLEAYWALQKTDISNFEDQIIFIADYIIDYLNEDKPLLNLISKHLSWGIFRNNLCYMHSADESSFYEIFSNFLRNSGYHFKDPEIMIYMIIELVGGSIYNPILYEQPCTLEEIKPYLHRSIYAKIESHIVKEGQEN